MGFYFRVAPGLKLRVTRGGLRIGVGPRAARLHLGAGGTGVSTGAGPWTYYQPLRTGQSRNGGTRRASSGFPTAADQKRAEAESISTELTRLLDLHREEFPAAAPPVVAPVAPTPLSEFTKRRRKQELAGIGFWRWSARRQARARAAADAQQDLAQEQARLDADRARAQQDADQWWQRLHVNDEDTVLDAVNTAFEDNEAPAVAVSVNGAEIELAVLVPDIDVVPERMPGVTDAGNLSLRRMRAGAPPSTPTW